MSPAVSVKNRWAQAGREPATLGSTAYLSTTAPHLHMICRQNFWYVKMLFVIQTWQIYMKFRYIYLQTYLSKRVFFKFKFHIMWKDLTPRVFPHFSQCLPLCHWSHTYTHDNWAKLLVSKTAFCHSNMANIYEVQVDIPTNISIKKSGKAWPQGSFHFLVSAPRSCRTGDLNSCPPANRTESYA
jgi:hypothetical protein